MPVCFLVKGNTEDTGMTCVAGSEPWEPYFKGWTSLWLKTSPIKKKKSYFVVTHLVTLPVYMPTPLYFRDGIGDSPWHGVPSKHVSSSHDPVEPESRDILFTTMTPVDPNIYPRKQSVGQSTFRGVIPRTLPFGPWGATSVSHCSARISQDVATTSSIGVPLKSFGAR